MDGEKIFSIGLLAEHTETCGMEKHKWPVIILDGLHTFSHVEGEASL